MGYNETALSLISRALPHEAVVYLAHRNGLSAEELASNHSTTAFEPLLDQVNRRFLENPKPKDDSLELWFEQVTRNLERTLGDILRNERIRKRHSLLLEIKIGRIYPQQLVPGNLEKAIREWQENMEDLRLVLGVLHGDKQASDQLGERHHLRIKGFIRMLTRDDEHLDELCSEAWLDIFRALKRFDPAWGSFHAFSNRRAKYVIARFWAKPAEPVLPSQSEGEEDSDNEDIDPWQSPPADRDLFDKLMLATFRGPSAPHQLIAFGYIQLLEWKPLEVFDEHSNARLKRLTELLEGDLGLLFTPHTDIVHNSFQNINRIMTEGRKGSQVLADANMRKMYPQLLQRVIAETQLQDYYTSKAEHPGDQYARDCCQNLTNWWVNVKKRVISQLAKEAC